MRPVQFREVQAVHIMARAQINSGYKTTNKEYSLTEGSKDHQKKLERNKNRVEGASRSLTDIRFREALPGGYRPQRDPAEIVETLLAMPPGERAGNCNEYTSLAPREAHNRHIPCAWEGTIIGDSRNKVGHAICVFGLLRCPDRYIRILNFPLLTNHPDSGDIFVSDPWANVVCPVSQYANMFMIKMNKWHSEGKRIFPYDGAPSMAPIAYGERIMRAEIKLFPRTDGDGNKILNSRQFYSSSLHGFDLAGRSGCVIS